MQSAEKIRKIFVVGGSVGYANWMEGTLVDDMEDADLVVFTGGADINPRYYGEVAHPKTYFNEKRDAFEIEHYIQAQALGKNCIGICRGLQLMCMMNGGRLIQDQDNPSTHPMQTFDGETIPITSIHHQAAYPFDLPKEDYIILGWTEGMLHRHQDGYGKEMHPPVEVEMIYFPKSKSFGIQGHPEMMKTDSKTIQYLRNLLTNILENKIPTNEANRIEKANS